MQICESTIVTRMPAVAMVTINKPARERLAWHVEQGFSDDLLLASQRTHIADVELNRTVSDNTVTISVKICNRQQEMASDLRLRAVVQDDLGRILNGTQGRLVRRVDSLEAGDSQSIELQWQGSCDAEPYHLLLVVEDASGNLQDTLAGQFVL